MPSYKFHYFNGKGRGEMVRMLFVVAGKEFEDVRFEQSEWPSLKEKFPYGQVPASEIDGKIYGQSMAIATYLAKEFGYYGKTNLDGFVIDQVLQLIQDLIQCGVKFYFEKDEAKKAELSKQFKETDAPRFFGFFENMLKESGAGFFVGNDITLADIAVYDVLTGMMASFMGPTEQFPMLKALGEKVGANEKLKEHMSKRPETPF